jgi:hypothetical protein
MTGTIRTTLRRPHRRIVSAFGQSCQPSQVIHRAHASAGERLKAHYAGNRDTNHDMARCLPDDRTWPLLAFSCVYQNGARGVTLVAVRAGPFASNAPSEDRPSLFNGAVAHARTRGRFLTPSVIFLSDASAR